MDYLLAWLAPRLCRLRRIPHRVDVSVPYLDRYYIFGNATSRWFLALHCIHRSDSDKHLHNHPWPYLACQLAGLMDEVTPSSTYRRRPGYLRWRPADSFHRLILPPGRRVWSLFLGGPRAGSWGFRVGRRTVDHVAHLGA